VRFGVFVGLLNQ